MFEGLQENQVKAAIEALLFVTDEPVSVAKLAEVLKCTPVQADSALHELQADFQTADRGIQLREVAGGWRLFTHPAFHELIESYVLSWDTRKLSAAAIETLAVVAYTQPVSRSGVSSVRGVNSDSSINSLVEKGLVREVGVAEAPGNPVLYGTTRTFLEKFGLRSVDDLPDIAEYAPDDETRRLITERLSANRADVAVSDEQARMMAEAMMYGEDGEPDEALDGFDEAVGIHPSAALEELAAVKVLGPVAADESVAAVSAAAGDDVVAALEQSAAAELEAGLGVRTHETIIATEPEELEAEVAEAAFKSAVDAAPIPAPGSNQEMFARAIASTLGVVDKIDFDSLVFDTDDE